MRRILVVAALPVALLGGCGTPMVWQGPAGTGQQELSDAKRECLSRSEAWRSQKQQVAQQTVIPDPSSGQQNATDYFYQTEDRLFNQCMVAQGYKLVRREQ